MNKRKVILIVIIFSICLQVLNILFNYRNIILFYFCKANYSEIQMIQKYFNISLGENDKILQYFISDSKSKGVPTLTLSAELLVNYDLVDDILKNYENCTKVYDETIGFDFVNAINGNKWSFAKKIDYCIWDVAVASFRTVKGHIRKQRDVYIMVSEEDDGKCHIFLLRSLIGWNE